MKRIVRLLDPPELTPRQLAQKRYNASAKGLAAKERYRAKKRQDAAWKAQNVIRAVDWDKRNRLHRRVYNRIWQQTNRRLKRAA